MCVRYILLLLFLWNCHEANADCKQHVPVNQTLCNEEYVDINDPDANIKKPLCFMTDMFVHGSNQAEWPCFLVNGTEGSGRHVEVLIELSQEGRVCISSDVPGNAESCNNGQSASFCGTVPGGVDNIKYTVYCAATNCNVDLKFWYRITVEEPDEDGNFHENWCAARSGSFPSSLMQLPAGGVAVPQAVISQPGDSVVIRPPGGAAGFVQSSKFATVVFVTAALALLNIIMF